jgi:hypothetical protein
MSEEKNMQFWKKVCKTNPAETKAVDYPFKHTAIGAMFQIKHATEQWGMFGDKWGVKDEKFTPVFFETDHRGFLIYTAILFYPSEGNECEIPIHADANFYNRTKNGYQIENDISKKIATDALTKGLSKVGFNADVFEGLFDDNKYVQQMIKHFANPDKPEEKEKGNIKNALTAIGNVKTLPELEAIEKMLVKRSWTEEEEKQLEQCTSAMRGTLQC